MRINARPIPAATASRASVPAPVPARDRGPTLDVFGLELPRLRPDLPSERVKFGDRALDFAYRVYQRSPLGKVDQEKKQVERALAAPLIKGKEGAVKHFGDVTVVVNGLLNLNTPAATLFRLAQYTKGPVIVASNNPTGGKALDLRPLEQVWGDKVPEALRGKMFIIGNFEPHITPWTDGADLLLEQLDVVGTRFPQIAGESKAKDFAAAKVTVLGYSQGALSAMSARRRLNDAGAPEIIDRVVSLAGSIEGTQFAKNRVLRWALGKVDDKTGARALEENRPAFVTEARERMHLGPDLIDLAYGASADGGGKGVEPIFRLTRKLMPGESGADGVIATVTPDDAKRVVVDEKPKTHLMLWKDWETIDTLVEALPADW